MGSVSKVCDWLFCGFCTISFAGNTAGGKKDALKEASAHLDAFRKYFFALAFFSIGISADFRRLWREGLGRLVAVYVVCLFGFVIWIGLGISWLFFHGVMPPSGP